MDRGTTTNAIPPPYFTCDSAGFRYRLYAKMLETGQRDAKTFLLADAECLCSIDWLGSSRRNERLGSTLARLLWEPHIADIAAVTQMYLPKQFHLSG